VTDRPMEPAVAPPAAPGEPPRRAVVVAEGGYAMRVLLPERILVGVDYEIILEAWRYAAQNDLVVLSFKAGQWHEAVRVKQNWCLDAPKTR